MSKDYFFYKDSGETKKIRVHEITYLQASDNYVIAHLINGRCTIRATFNSILEQLFEYPFWRVHRSYAVAIDCIEVIRTDTILLTDKKTELPAQKRYLNSRPTGVEIILPNVLGCDDECDRLPGDDESI
jgi:DNA-binding LytR/AlgR family response regulator